MSLTLGCDGHSVPFVFPLSYWLSPFLPSPRALRLLKLGVMQFVFVLPLWSAASLLADRSKAIVPREYEPSQTLYTQGGALQAMRPAVQTAEHTPQTMEELLETEKTIPQTEEALQGHNERLAHAFKATPHLTEPKLGNNEEPLWGENKTPQSQTVPLHPGEHHRDSGKKNKTTKTDAHGGIASGKALRGSLVAPEEKTTFAGSGTGGRPELELTARPSLFPSVPMSAALLFEAFLGLLLSVSMFVSMLSLSQFYIITEPYLQPYEPRSKFFLIQLLVFTNSWQRLFVWLLGLLGALPAVGGESGMGLDQGIVRTPLAARILQLLLIHLLLLLESPQVIFLFFSCCLSCFIVFHTRRNVLPSIFACSSFLLLSRCKSSLSRHCCCFWWYFSCCCCRTYITICL